MADCFGMSTIVWQCGHLPFLPAADPGVFTVFPQLGQKNSIGPAGAGAAAGAASAPLAPGIVVTVLHPGHLPFLPAADAGVFIVFPQFGHENSMVAAALADAAALDVAAALELDATLAELSCDPGAGIVVRSPHCGHCPCLPAADSGARIARPQPEHENSIVMGDMVRENSGRLRIRALE